jgi:hypothetical protein
MKEPQTDEYRNGTAEDRFAALLCDHPSLHYTLGKSASTLYMALDGLVLHAVRCAAEYRSVSPFDPAFVRARNALKQARGEVIDL